MNSYEPISTPIVYFGTKLSTYDFSLRILASYEGKTAKISNFWTFWPVIQLIVQIFDSSSINRNIKQGVKKVCF